MAGRQHVLVIGGDGLLGGAMAAALRAGGHEVTVTTRRPDAVWPGRLWLDLSAREREWSFPPRVDVALLCAGVASIHACRAAPEITRHVNGPATARLAARLLECGAFVVFPSTNLVFDGERPWRHEDDPVAPRTEYGRQKTETERCLLALGDAVAIVRLTKVWGSHVPLLSAWAAALRQQEPIHPFADAMVAPVHVDEAARLLGVVALGRLGGVSHVSGDRDVSYAEIGHRLARRLMAAPSLVRPRAAPADELWPRHTTLAMRRLGAIGGFRPSDVWDTIDRILV
jgi:dTDP-4-dehydrorhamnose reductase